MTNLDRFVEEGKKLLSQAKKQKEKKRHTYWCTRDTELLDMCALVMLPKAVEIIGKLLPYTNHTDDCSVGHPPCECGWDKARTDIEAMLEKDKPCSP